MKRLLVVLCALSAISSSAFAAPPAASEDSIRRLLEVTEARKLLDGMMAQVDALMRRNMEQALRGRQLTPEQEAIIARMRGRMADAFREEMAWDKLEPLYVRVYRDTFTQDEVDGMLAFYRTDAGRALIVKMPAVIQTTMGDMQQRMQPLVQKMRAIEEEALTELRATERPPATR
ncbi:MAG TPA: DUF2059 domain-containing protein [Burkholderiales bacterium]|nr:DUF2059 domain-containing protein [Burkholderiales bacterium]